MDYDEQLRKTYLKINNKDFNIGDIFTEFLTHFEIILDKEGDVLTILNSTFCKIHTKTINEYAQYLIVANQPWMLYLDSDDELNKIVIKKSIAKLNEKKVEKKDIRKSKLFLISLLTTKYGEVLNLDGNN